MDKCNGWREVDRFTYGGFVFIRLFQLGFLIAATDTLLATITLFIEYPWAMDDSGSVEELLYGPLKLYWNI